MAIEGVTRANIDSLLNDVNEQQLTLGMTTLAFSVYTPGDDKGSRYQLVRTDNNQQVSSYINIAEMYQVLHTLYNVQELVVRKKRKG